ncbi:hypothetical protein D9758_003894 [Tetrapyrgos nigripes]|uniref:C2H2-type domain-containing protein n=1 Tax=Tetrapyrgos nigripes TaxID=182062 RepID=A0A8H5GLE5_9AGAR|nr:hypothetical protein D9758_003894 [Tetrapyrgos nigripes]
MKPNLRSREDVPIDTSVHNSCSEVLMGWDSSNNLDNISRVSDGYLTEPVISAYNDDWKSALGLEGFLSYPYLEAPEPRDQSSRLERLIIPASYTHSYPSAETPITDTSPPSSLSSWSASSFLPTPFNEVGHRLMLTATSPCGNLEEANSIIDLPHQQDPNVPGFFYGGLAVMPQHDIASQYYSPAPATDGKGSSTNFPKGNDAYASHHQETSSSYQSPHINSPVLFEHRASMYTMVSGCPSGVAVMGDTDIDQGSPTVAAPTHLAVVRPVVAGPALVGVAINRRQVSDPGKLQYCHLCQASFTAKHNLTNHLNSHYDIRKHECGGCGSAFGTKHVLKRHERSCNGVPRKALRNRVRQY